MLGPEADWDDRTELLAEVVDRLGHIDFLLRRAHFKGNAEPPKPVPRPSLPEGNGQAPDGEPQAGTWVPSAAEVAEFLASPDR